MTVFLVELHRTGPSYDVARELEQQSGWAEHAAFMDDLVARGHVLLGGPLSDGLRVVLALEADSESHLRTLLEPDPWHGSHLVLASVESWTIRLRGAL